MSDAVALTFDLAILATSWKWHLGELRMTAVAVFVVSPIVTVRNESRVLAFSVVQLDRVLTPIINCHAKAPEVN